MKKIVALYSSRAQSGKSQVARVFDEAGWETVKFAGPIKDMVRGLLRSMGFDEDTVERMVEGDLKEVVIPGFGTVTPRHLQQTLGTDWGREAVMLDLWTRVALSKIDKSPYPVIIDDLRFPNEYTELCKLGALIVRVHRPGHIAGNGNPRYEGLLDNHTFDVTITNEGGLEELRSNAIDLYEDAERLQWPAA